jgi:hypothetical protein
VVCPCYLYCGGYLILSSKAIGISEGPQDMLQLHPWRSRVSGRRLYNSRIEASRSGSSVMILIGVVAIALLYGVVRGGPYTALFVVCRGL